MGGQQPTQASGSLLYRIAAFSALGGFLFGYDLGLIGGALLNIQQQWSISTLQIEIIVGAAKFGAVFGSLLGGAFMLQFGRRKAIALDSIFFIIGPILMMSAWDITLLVVGRFVIGIGIGVSAVVTPAYLGEMAPARRRGMIVALYEVMLCAGMFASLITDSILNPYWRLMVGMPMIPAIALAFAMCVLPESPRWLLLVGDYDGALAVIQQISAQKMISDPGRARAEAEDELLHLWSSVEKGKYAQAEAREKILQRRRAEGARGSCPEGEMEVHGQGGGECQVDQVYLGDSMRCTDSSSQVVDMDGSTVEISPSTVKSGGIQGSFLATMWVMITDVYVVAVGEEARPFAICCWLSFFNQATASTAIINYAPSVLKEIAATMGTEAGAGLSESAILWTAPVAAAKFVGVLIGLFTFDLLGRRWLLISSSFGSGLAMVLLTWGVRAGSVALSVAAMCLFILTFSWGWASGFWLLVSELFSMAAKSPAASAVTAGLFFFGFLTNLVFLSIYDTLKEWTFLLFGGVALLSGLYVAAVVPETKGKTLLQIQEMLESGDKETRLKTSADSNPGVAANYTNSRRRKLSWKRFLGLG